MRIPYGWVQGSGYNTCTGKYCIICPGGTKRRKKKEKKQTKNNSSIPYSEGSLPRKHNFLKLKHENVFKMKNKPYQALLRPSNLSNEIKKGIKIS
jgi:hypothetical protein